MNGCPVSEVPNDISLSLTNNAPSPINVPVGDNSTLHDRKRGSVKRFPAKCRSLIEKSFHGFRPLRCLTSIVSMKPNRPTYPQFDPPFPLALGEWNDVS